MTEYVYVLTNPAMPKLIKIGETENIERRLKELYTTAVPFPFQCYCCYEVENRKKVEDIMHEAFSEKRENDRREFFKMKPEKAQSLLEKLSIREYFIETDSVGTEEYKEGVKDAVKKYSRLSPFDFLEVDIPQGSTLTFIDDEIITAKVIGNKKILFDGKETSLSPAATKAFAKIGKKKEGLQGTMYWKFNGELLTKIREEKLSKENINEGSPSGYFVTLGIPKGSTLTFANDESIIATAIGNNKVEFNGEILSLTAAAREAFNKIGKKRGSLQGPMYWKYKGKRLTDI